MSRRVLVGEVPGAAHGGLSRGPFQGGESLFGRGFPEGLGQPGSSELFQGLLRPGGKEERKLDMQK